MNEELLAMLNGNKKIEKNDNYTSFSITTPSGSFIGYINLLKVAVEIAIPKLAEIGLVLVPADEAGDREIVW